MEDIVRDLSERHQRWVEEEGGIEGSTHLETLMQPEQQKRIEWLKSHCYPETSILDIGCNWGWILDRVNGRCGVDINPVNIALARKKFPQREFVVGDVTKKLDFKDKSFDVVIEADLLEHLEWFDSVENALEEGIRVAKKRLLITLPWRKTSKCALCFKHRWVVTGEKVGKVKIWLVANSTLVSLECDGVFVYLEASLPKSES